MTASDYRLRPMQEIDLAAYKQLRDSMLVSFPEAFTSAADIEQARSAESYRSRIGLSDGGHALFTLCAWASGVMVGAITAEFDPRAKIRHIAHIVGMMVSPPAQGRGLGRALMARALVLLEADHRLELVTLSVTANNRAAVHLYASCGFTRYGRLENAIKLPDGRRLDKDLMSRGLSR